MTPSDTAHPGRAEALNALECLVVLVAMDDAQLAADLESKIKPFLSVVRPQGEEGLWRPISEAPTDGTHFLAHYIDLVDEYDEEDRLIARAVPTASIGVAYHVDWLGGILDYPYQGRIVQGRRYTDWQPLPAPPTHSNQGKPSS